MVCGNFILPEPTSYVFFYAFFNLRKLLYIILGVVVSLKLTNKKQMHPMWIHLLFALVTKYYLKLKGIFQS